MSDEHESSEGDCDMTGSYVTVAVTTLSDEHESSEGDCDLVGHVVRSVRESCYVR